MSSAPRSVQSQSGPSDRPLLIVLSGPSGVGKDAVLGGLKGSGFPLRFVTTLTTRARRPGERDMVDYGFVSCEAYHKLRDEGGLLESANVYGNWYGVPRAPVKEALDNGDDVIIMVDVQGAASIREAAPEAICIFLVAPSPEELAARLTRRLTESPADLELRLKTAEEEMRRVSEFDYVVVNDSIEAAVERIKTIIAAEKRNEAPRRAPPS